MTTLHVVADPTPSEQPSQSSSSSSPPSSSSSPNVSSEIAAHTTIPDSVYTTGMGRSLRPLLKIIAVTVSGPAGSVDTFALLDDGSTATLIDADLSRRIGATGPEGLMFLNCVGGLSVETPTQFVNFQIKGRYKPNVFSIGARTIDNLKLCGQSALREEIDSYPHLSDLSSELSYESGTPMLIIGIDNWHLSVANATRRGNRSQPVAILTPLGWVVFGFSNSKTDRIFSIDSSERIFHTAVTDDVDPKHELEEMIKEQYRLDSIGISKHVMRSGEDQRALQILERTAHRLPSGRWEAGLLWKADNPVVPDSFPLAFSRFRSLERKMIADPVYAERYRQNIHDTLNKDYAEECTDVKPIGVCWYLPHFGVINPNKPQKLRVVHDAAAKSCGVSLNSLLLTGPDLLRPSLGILMRFREGQIALTADIREMFPQVKIRDLDRDAQRFLWRDDPTGPLKVYRMSSMTFGACSSPATAIYMTNRNASDFRNEFPEAVEAIANDTYMDDYIASVDGIDHAARLASEIVTIHKRGGFEMRGWISNEPGALSTLPKDLISDLVNPNVDLNASSRTLGLIWKPKDDLLAFNAGLKVQSSAPISKRQALAQVMRVYDPLGISTPIVIKGRILFQNLWRKGFEWDENLPPADLKVWQGWYASLNSISELKIPRRYSASDANLSKRELHVFCDASELAYAAVAYWRFVYANGEVKLALIASKARVAPLKPTSIPHLELQGALIAVRLASYIVSSHRFTVDRRFFWCDSMTVLGWLRNDARNFKPFVAHRVGEILENSTLNEWRWVPGELNVADDATRTKISTMSVDSRWITGPSFLTLDSMEWPSEPVGNEPLALQELKASARVRLHVIDDFNVLSLPVSADPSRFSSWLKLIRATARAHQFICKLRKRSDSNSPPPFSRALTHSEIIKAEVDVLKKSQSECFKTEINILSQQLPLPASSRLASLSPKLDDDGLLRMFGRITAANVDYNARRPILLDAKSLAVRLLIRHYHTKFAHANTESVINEIRQGYWILSLRNAVRSIVRSCQRCKLLRGSALRPPMGDLPEARLAHHQRPFTFVGVDYFGPLSVTVGRRHEKRWVALFTCLTTRAIHLEVVHSLSSDSALMCLRRFIARRGTPTEIHSDNGTSFVGANRELRTLYGDAVADYAANLKIKWKFIPPSAPFMGGAWERLVKSVKIALRATLRERAPKDEVLSTLLTEAEALVNSRPLTHVSPDSTYPEALTPFHFLLGSSSGQQVPAHLTDADLCSRSGWRKALRLADHFWQRWVSEYLPSLSPRRVRGTDVQIDIGTPVIIVDGNLPRGSWPRGVVSALFPGRDGVARVAEVRTAAGKLKRPLRKLVPL